MPWVNASSRGSCLGSTRALADASSHCPLCSCKACAFCDARGAALALMSSPPPPDPACATVARRGAWAEGAIAQVPCASRLATCSTCSTRSLAG